MEGGGGQQSVTWTLIAFVNSDFNALGSKKEKVKSLKDTFFKFISQFEAWKPLKNSYFESKMSHGGSESCHVSFEWPINCNFLEKTANKISIQFIFQLQRLT